MTARTETIEVEVKVLDDIAASLDIRPDLLVQIDIQGFEDRAIRGGMETIGVARACVIEIQVAELYEGQPDLSEIHALMNKLGFAFHGVLDQYSDVSGKVLYFDAVFLKD